MRKFFKVVSLVILSALALSLASCHGTRNYDAFVVQDNFNESKSYEITFWAKNENNANQRAVYDYAIDEFEKLYPNIKVTIKHYTDYGAIYNDVITNIQTGTTPNVCITYPDHIATYKTGENIVVPLTELAVDEKYGLGGSEVKFDSPSISEIVPEFLDECYVGGTLYALPFMRSTEACYVNETLLLSLGYESVPEILTWDFIFEASNKALQMGKETVKDESGKDVSVYVANGKTVFKPVIYKSTDNMMIQMLRQKGAEYSTADGDVLLFNDTTKELLYMVKENAASGAFTTFKIDSYPGNYLNRGECLFAIDSTAGATWMGSDAPLMDVHASLVADFDTAVRPVPQFDTENVQMISQGPSLCIFNKADPGEVMASWLFAQFLLTNDVQMAYSQTEGYAPVTLKAQNSDEYRDYLSRCGEDNELYYDVKIEATKLLIDNVENTFVTPVFNGSTSLRDASGQMIENVTKSTKRKQTVDDKYIEDLYFEMKMLYKLDRLVVGEKEGQSVNPLSVGLIVSISLIWLGIASYLVTCRIRKARNEKIKKN